MVIKNKLISLNKQKLRLDKNNPFEITMSDVKLMEFESVNKKVIKSFLKHLRVSSINEQTINQLLGLVSNKEYEKAFNLLLKATTPVLHSGVISYMDPRTKLYAILEKHLALLVLEQWKRLGIPEWLDLNTDWTTVLQPGKKLFVEIGSGNGVKSINLATNTLDTVFIFIEPLIMKAFLSVIELRKQGVKDVYVIMASDKEALSAQKGESMVDVFYRIGPNIEENFYGSPSFINSFKETHFQSAMRLLPSNGRIVVVPFLEENDRWAERLEKTFAFESAYILERSNEFPYFEALEKHIRVWNKERILLPYAEPFIIRKKD